MLTGFALRRLVALLHDRIDRDQVQALRSTTEGHVCPEIHLAVTLRWLAGGSYLDVHQGHGIAKSTFWHCVHRTLVAIEQCPELGFEFPSTEADLRAVADGFARKSEQQSFADAVGAIDGLLVGIQCPAKTAVANPGRYYTRKCKYALNVQAICDANRRFSWVSILTPGSVHDGIAFGLTDLGSSAVRWVASSTLLLARGCSVQWRARDPCAIAGNRFDDGSGQL